MVLNNLDGDTRSLLQKLAVPAYLDARLVNIIRNNFSGGYPYEEDVLLLPLCEKRHSDHRQFHVMEEQSRAILINELVARDKEAARDIARLLWEYVDHESKHHSNKLPYEIKLAQKLAAQHFLDLHAYDEWWRQARSLNIFELLLEELKKINQPIEDVCMFVNKSGPAFLSEGALYSRYIEPFGKSRTIAKILNGELNFAGQISPKLYWLLEGAWLSDLITEWPGFDNRYGESSGVSRHLQNLLSNRGMKGKVGEESFLVKHHFNTKYFSSSGVISESKAVQDMVQQKAERIRMNPQRWSSHEENWKYAKNYVEKFYNNILPAIEENGEKKVEKVELVLEAFRSSTRNSLNIISCFEAALAIYFLDWKIIEKQGKRVESIFPA